MSHKDSNLKDLVKRELYSRYTLVPTDEWLVEFLSTISRPPPLPALTSTAHFRLTTTDFIASLNCQPDHVFPSNANDVQVKSLSLQTSIPVQVLEILDVGSSKSNQIEAIERIERGEEVRGREVIRNVPATEGDSSEDGAQQSINSSKKGSVGPHKLLLQDAAGAKLWALELTRIEKITISQDGMQIGCKILLKQGTKIQRGLIMLTPPTTTIMGGKIEAWDKRWREGRKMRLQQMVDTENA